MSLLFTSDWHLTDKSKDSYRWDIFPWMVKQATNRKAEAIFILGDITDSKNHHANEFINRVVDQLRILAKICPVHILAGNHDSSDPSAPLLRFLNEPGLRFYAFPTSIKVAGKRVLILPNERSKIVFANRLEEFHATDHHFVLMHQTFKGSIVANGMEMDGIDPNMGAVSDTIWISGDIHVPQQIGDVLYCGAPHPINFGDSYTPRILLWDRKGVRSLIRSATKKHVIETATISDPKIGDIAPGDFAKVILKLTPADSTEWETQRSLLEQMAARGGWTLAGFEVRIEDPSGPLKGRASKELKSPADVLKDFCAKNSIPTEMLTLGEKLLNDTV